jgi:hypothetical protein
MLASRTTSKARHFRSHETPAWLHWLGFAIDLLAFDFGSLSLGNFGLVQR